MLEEQQKEHVDALTPLQLAIAVRVLRRLVRECSPDQVYLSVAGAATELEMTSKDAAAEIAPLLKQTSANNLFFRGARTPFS
jgi:hypothetical protein